ncbi:hypothetical protein, partial [Enterobacter asburiae]
LTVGCCQWRFVVSLRVGLNLIFTRLNARVGMYGGFVQKVQLGPNCHSGTEFNAWNDIKRAKKAE